MHRQTRLSVALVRCLVHGLAGAVSVFAAGTLSGAPLPPALPDVVVGPPFIVASGGPFRHLPFLYAGDGTAIVALSQHVDGIVYPSVDAIALSPDGGKSWPLYEAHRDFYLSCMTRLPDGRLFAVCYVTRRAGPREIAATCWSSADGGRTWRSFIGHLRLPRDQFQGYPNGWGGLLFHRSLWVRPNGEIMASLYGRYATDRRYRVVLAKSEDGGADWTIASTVASDPSVGTEGFCEPAIIPVADGSLLAVMRTGSGADPLYQARSRDGGLSWSLPSPLPGVDPRRARSVDPDLILMSNGILALSFGRPATSLLFSSDGCGFRWDKEVSPVFGGRSTSGYTGLREVAPGRLLIVTDAAGGTEIIGAFVDVRGRPSSRR